MSNEQEIIQALEETIVNTENVNQDYKKVLTTTGEVDVTLADGSTTPNLNKRVRTVIGEVPMITDGNVTLEDGGNQREFNTFVKKNGAALPWMPDVEYALHAPVTKSDGTLVQSTVAGNKTNPNVDMTGWSMAGGGIKVVESIADMLAIKNPRDGDVVLLTTVVDGVYIGGGHFRYKPARLSENDGGTVFNGWERVHDGIAYAEWWGGGCEDGSDDTDALQKALDFCSGTEWKGSVGAMNASQSRASMRLLDKQYNTTRTLWVGAGQSLTGSRKLGFIGYRDAKNAPTILANLTDPLTAAISTSNFRSDGSRIAFNEQTTGADYDAGRVSSASGINLTGFSVVTSVDSRGFMGVRIQSAPRSNVNLFVAGFDWAVFVNASWVSTFDCTTLHYKCGLFLNLDNNDVYRAGYYNGMKGAPISEGKNFADFFGGDTGIPSQWNADVVQFGCINRYSYGSTAGQLVAEFNDVGVVTSNSGDVIACLYTEGNRITGYAGFANSTTVVVDNWVGAADKTWAQFGVGANFEVGGIRKHGTVRGDEILGMSQYVESIVFPKTTSVYHPAITYSNLEQRVLYVDAATGDDLNTGFMPRQPLKTIDAALDRCQYIYTMSDLALKALRRTATTIYVSQGSYSITKRYVLGGHVDVAAKNPTQKPIINLSGNVGVQLNDTSIVFRDVDVRSVGSADLNHGFAWLSNGRCSLTLITSQVDLKGSALLTCEANGSSDSTLVIDRSDVVADAAAALVYGNWNNQSPHIISVVRAQGSISSTITARPDNGVAVPDLWKSKVIL